MESASKESSLKTFFEILDFVKQNEIQDIVYDKIDRATRGFKATSMLEEIMETHDVRLHFTRDNLIVDKNSPPQEKLRFGLGATFAKYYIDNLKSEVKKGVSERVESGQWAWKAPFGYINYRDPVTRRSTIIQDEKLAPALAEVFERYASGDCNMPDLIKIVSSAAGKELSWTKLPIILSNPFYCGVMKVKGKVLPASHEPIITKELWTACQRVRGARAARYVSKAKKKAVLKAFMRFMKCASCGHWITGEAVVKSKDVTYVYYRCAHRACEANSKRINQDKINEQVSAAFEPFEKFSEALTEAFIATLRGRMMDIDAYATASIARLRGESKKLKERILIAQEMTHDGLITKEVYDATVSPMMDRLAEIEAEVSGHNKADGSAYEEGLRVIQLFTKISHYSKLDANLVRKSQLAKTLLSNLFLEGGKLRYTYVSGLDNILELSLSREWWGLSRHLRTAIAMRHVKSTSLNC